MNKGSNITNHAHTQLLYFLNFLAKYCRLKCNNYTRTVQLHVTVLLCFRAKF